MTVFLLVAKVAAVLLVLGIALALSRKRSASWRCTLTRLGFWSVALLPLMDLWGPQWLLRVLPAPRGRLLLFTTAAPVESGLSLLAQLCVGVFVGGAVLGAGALMRDLGRLLAELRRCAPFASPTRSRTRVLVSSRIDSPFTVGFFRPVIVLPQSAYEWTSDRLLSVLAHEEAHVRRLDWAQFIAMRLTVALLWPNVLLRWLDRSAHLACEQACDDEVLRRGVSGPEYARHLLSLAQSPGRPVFPTAAMAAPCALEVRVRGVLIPTVERGTGSTIGRLTAVAAGVLTIAGLGGMTLAPTAVVKYVFPTSTMLFGRATGASGTMLRARWLDRGVERAIVIEGSAILPQDASGVPRMLRLQAP
jgi:hypothetical protein